jgi:hypothetical protein
MKSAALVTLRTRPVALFLGSSHTRNSQQPAIRVNAKKPPLFVKIVSRRRGLTGSLKLVSVFHMLPPISQFK